jgi:hypothetical protein
MARRNAGKTGRARLPAALRPLFWDYDFAALRWDTDRDLIAGRVLSAGEWDSVRWLIRRMGKPALRDWIVRRQGAGLSLRQLCFWQIVLDIPRRQVKAWLAPPGRQPWDRRRHE